MSMKLTVMCFTWHSDLQLTYKFSLYDKECMWCTSTYQEWLTYQLLYSQTACFLVNSEQRNSWMKLFVCLFPSFFVSFSDAVSCWNYIALLVDGWMWSIDGMILTGETKVLGENLSQCHTVNHKFHIARPGIKCGTS